VCGLASSLCALLLDSAFDTCALAPSTAAFASEGADVADLDLLNVPMSTGDRTGECPGERRGERTGLAARALGIERFFSELTFFIVDVRIGSVKSGRKSNAHAKCMFYTLSHDITCWRLCEAGSS
jgi:hypothetical protein